jgi:hypothetical protein
MALIVLIAVVLIIFGFARAMHDQGDEAEGGPDPADEPENAPERTDDPTAAPEEAPRWTGEEGEPGWRPSSGIPAALLGAAPPSLEELIGRAPERTPEGPVEGWIMPEPDSSEMEHPEDYGIDNGDPETPMWTPPEPEPAPEPEPKADTPRPGDGLGLFGQWCLYRGIIDALYLMQAFFLMSSGRGLMGARFQLDDPGAREALLAAAGLLFITDFVVLALWKRKSGWVRQAFLFYVLVDLALRALNVANGLAVGGTAMGNTFIGALLAIASDGFCAWYLMRSVKAPGAED